jgi:predicted Fe-S protein YdhL (DUF1289 family)
MTNEVTSPCVKVCRLNDSGDCLGCGRTRDEIGSWMRASNEEKASILEAATARLEIMQG